MNVKDNRILATIVILFLVLIAFLLLDEIWDIPHKLLGFQMTPANYPEMIIEICAVILTGTVCLFFLVRYQRKKIYYEQQILNAMNQKEILFKESNHRIKNNLTMIAGIIDLQFFSSDSPDLRASLGNLKNKILSISIIHEQLSLASDLKTIRIKEYFPILLQTIISTGSKKIQVQHEIDDIPFKPERVVHLAIITTELVMNALKHAFFQENDPLVFFSLTKKNLHYVLSVENNGASMPENFTLDKPVSLGLSLVKTLVKQIRGTIEVEDSTNTRFTITFPQ